MDKKITRRAVLGTAIVGLAAMPFVMRALRKPQPIELSPYGKIDFSPRQFDSPLPSDEFSKAFGTFFAERSKWVRFRGVSGKINFGAEASQNGRLLPPPPGVEGRFAFRLIERNENVFGESELPEFPYDYSIEFSDVVTGQRKWSLVYDRKTNQRIFEGETGEAPVDTPDIISHILAFPAEVFVSFTNIKLGGAQGLWKVSGDGSQACVFEPNDELTGEGSLMPTFSFVEGRLRELSGKQMKNTPFPVILLDKYEEVNGFHYPLVQTFEYRGDGRPMAKKLKFLLKLSDVNVTMVS